MYIRGRVPGILHAPVSSHYVRKFPPLGSFLSNPQTVSGRLGSRRGRGAGNPPGQGNEEVSKLSSRTSQASHPWQCSSGDRGPDRAEVNRMGKSLRYLLFILRQNQSPKLTHDQWSDVHTVIGDVNYLEVLGQPLIVLNSYSACKDLLEKRSRIYSSRPRLVLLSEL